MKTTHGNLAHASALNLKTVQFFLLITTGMVIPEWLGRILKTQYNSREQAADLIDGGDMSSCWNDTVWGDENMVLTLF